MLPTRPPALITTLLLLVIHWLTRHRIDVSDSHDVCSQAVPPTLPYTDTDASPTLPPCNVKLAEPVAALFRLIKALVLHAANEKANDKLPVSLQVDSTIRTLPESPCVL
jgi:hypothetical protein